MCIPCTWDFAKQKTLIIMFDGNPISTSCKKAAVLMSYSFQTLLPQYWLLLASILSKFNIDNSNSTFLELIKSVGIVKSNIVHWSNLLRIVRITQASKIVIWFKIDDHKVPRIAYSGRKLFFKDTRGSPKDN